jgi:hypothetical protein
MKSILFATSLLFNLVLGAMLFWKAMDGCQEITDGKLGILTREVRVGVFGADKTLLTLPRGLVVRDASATGMDRLEPHRFKIVVTSEAVGLVDYVEPTAQANPHGEFYSADLSSQTGTSVH